MKALVTRPEEDAAPLIAELRARGVPARSASASAGAAHGPWRLSASPAVNQALPDAYFESLGLPTLAVRSAA